MLRLPVGITEDAKELILEIFLLTQVSWKQISTLFLVLPFCHCFLSISKLAGTKCKLWD
jgi:hypothetical protein